MPSLAGTSGRALTTTTSMSGIISWMMETPSGLERSSGRLRLPRLRDMNVLDSLGMNSSARRQGSPSMGSTLITSAPMSASIMPPNGPAIICVNSRILIPSSGPAM